MDGEVTSVVLGPLGHDGDRLGVGVVWFEIEGESWEGGV